MQVAAGMAVAGFPDFPRSGVLVILDPPCEVGGRELIGCAAAVTTPAGATRVIEYQYWQVNSKNNIGLLFERIQPHAVPLRSTVTFVKKPARSSAA